MIIPSIDLLKGRTVQLVGGDETNVVIDAGDPAPLAEKFRLAGEVAVVDLDAALGKGSNAERIRGLLPIAPIRVGGGIRDVRAAIDWLDAGAAKIVLGTAAKPEILKELPKDRLIAALDAVDGEVVVQGWKTRTGQDVLSRVRELKGFVSGFLVTFVEREGRMGGIDLAKCRELVEAAGEARVTIAGGVTSPADIAALDRIGADAQVGMALYTGKLDLADAIAAPLVTDRPDGLWATVVVDESGKALGLAWSDAESLREAVKTGRGVYKSRTRGLWVKGKTSGATQDLLRVDLDCDRDAIRFTVRQNGAGFCHKDTRTCWGEDRGIPELVRKLAERLKEAPEGSYTRRLLADSGLLKSKLIEEAGELSEASGDEVAREAADLIYFAAVALARAGTPLSAVEAELDRRAMKVTRRPGNAKG